MQIQIPSGYPFRFRVEDGKVLLLPEWEVKEKRKKWCNIAQVQLTGSDHNEHHGGKHHHSSGVNSLKYVCHRYADDLLEILLEDGQVEMTCCYRFYPQYRTLRSWATLKNISADPVGVDYIASFSLLGQEGTHIWKCHNNWNHEIQWRRYSLLEMGLVRGTGDSTGRITCTNTGAWSTKEYLPMGILEGETVCLWQIEGGPGWHWELSEKGQMLCLHLSGPTEQENGWHKELKPGESFTTIAAAITFAEDLDAAFAQRTHYCRAIAKRTPADQSLPVIFNDYMNCLKGDPTTEKELPVIDRAARVGAEYYVIDAGWYGVGSWWDTVGQWQECRERFPGGLREVCDYVRSKGMIPGIWLEIESMGVRCPILDQFDDTCFFMRHGRRVIDHGRYQLDFRNAQVRRFATDVVDRLMADLDVGYIKMDYNIEPGVGTEVDADSFGDGLHGHRLAFLSWIDSISEKYPHLIIENCASGGMRMDYQMLSHFSLQSTSDQESCLETAHIAAAAATAVLPEQAAVWSYPLATDTDERIRLNMVNAMLTRIHLSGKIMELSESQLQPVAEGVALYKQLRHTISEATPFYPCGIPTYDQKLFCAGYRGKQTYLAIWRLDTEEATLHIPVNTAHARVLYGNARVAQTAEGIAVTLPQEGSAAIIQV